MRRLALATAGLAALIVLPGCETTADKSARLRAQAKAVRKERGLRVTRLDADVRVVSSATITDANGTAAVVTLRDTGRSAIADVPIAIDVRSRAGASVFRNDAPGTEPGLVSAPLLSPGRDFTWVHDQVVPAGAPAARVSVRVGEARRVVARRLPEITVGAVRLTRDATSGAEGIGHVTNHSTIAQRRLTVYAVARRGGKVVAAGRAVVNRVAPGRSARFSVFFIGDPARARISVSAPPSVLG